MNFPHLLHNKLHNDAPIYIIMHNTMSIHFKYLNIVIAEISFDINIILYNPQNGIQYRSIFP